MLRQFHVSARRRVAFHLRKSQQAGGAGKIVTTSVVSAVVAPGERSVPRVSLVTAGRILKQES